jgi:polyphosphate glucokinase
MPRRPYTLSVDCGGTGLKCLVVDRDGHPVTRRVRVRTPYPCPPDALARVLVEIARATAHPFDRVSVGMPGLVRRGVVHWTPHYVTEAGPFTAVVPALVEQWVGLDVQALLERAYARPTRVVNDAEMAGLATISGQGYEVMMTLGTGLGFAHFDDGVLLPKIEVSAAPFGDGRTFDEALGHHARRTMGPDRWTDTVERALAALDRAFRWDRAYLGGGGAKFLARPLQARVELVANTAGVLGGVRLWDADVAPPRPPAPRTGQAEGDTHQWRAGAVLEDPPLGRPEAVSPARPSTDGSPATG